MKQNKTKTKNGINLQKMYIHKYNENIKTTKR